MWLAVLWGVTGEEQAQAFAKVGHDAVGLRFENPQVVQSETVDQRGNQARLGLSILLATERNDNAALKIFEDLGIELRNPVPGRGGGAVRDPDCGIFGTHASGREELGKPRHPGFKLVPPFRNCRYPFALTLDGTDERVRKQGVSIRGVILHRAGGEPGFLRHLPHAHGIEAARRDDADGRVGDGRGRF